MQGKRKAEELQNRHEQAQLPLAPDDHSDPVMSDLRCKNVYVHVCVYVHVHVYVHACLF